MGEVQRYTFCKESAIGPYMGSDPNGVWMEFDKHTAKVLELEAAVEVLAREVKRLHTIGEKAIHKDQTCSLEAQGYDKCEIDRIAALDTVGKLITSKSFHKPIKTNPIAAAAIQKARNDATGPS